MRETGNKGFIFGILGVLLIVIGIVLIVIGYNMAYGYSSFYINLEYRYQNHTKDTTGNHLIIGGVAAAILGVVFLAVCVYLYIKSRREMSKIVLDDAYNDVDDVMIQLAGTNTIFDIFHSEDRQKVFSFYRDKTCIFKEGDTVRRGKMEPLTWEAGRPTLWRITLDFDGRQESCEISKVDGNILVKSDVSEEVFYRN